MTGPARTFLAWLRSGNPLGGLSLEQAWQDVRFGMRALSKSPGVALTAIATLAIGIAVVTAMFSVMNTAVLRPPPYPNAGRIVGIAENTNFLTFNQSSAATIEALRKNARSFERVAAYDHTGGLVVAAGGVRSVTATRVDGSALPMLGVAPQLGRVFTGDEIAARAAVAVISDGLWRSQFGESQSALGQSLRFGQGRYTVIGVMPPGFGFDGRSDVWLPLPPIEANADQRSLDYYLLAELRPGVSRNRARAEVATIGRQLARSDPAHYRNVHLDMQDGMVQNNLRVVLPVLLLFFGAGAMVLLIACGNVANLMLMRATERRREMAVRASLGAGRARLVRQALAESLLLATAAAALGVYLCRPLIALLPRLVDLSHMPTSFQLGVDWRVLAFAAGLTVLTVLMIGLSPALDGTRFDLVRVLKTGGDGGATSARVIEGGRRGIVVQSALSVMLVMNAVLLGVSYMRLVKVDPGYARDQMLELSLNGDPNTHPDGLRAGYDVSLLPALEADPRIRSVAREGYFRWQWIGGDTARPRDPYVYRAGDTHAPAFRYTRPASMQWVVSDNYFKTMGILLIAGRGFAPSDVAGGPPVAVVSHAFAALVWPGQDPIGKEFSFGPGTKLATVVGMTGDQRDPVSTSDGITTAGSPNVFVSERQGVASNLLMLEIRAAGSPEALMPFVESRLQYASSDVQAFFIRPPALAIGGETFMVLRVTGSIVGACAGIALFLSIVGLYASIGYAIALRRREIGIRLALGGTPAQIRSHITGSGMRVVAIGLVGGVVLAVPIALLMRSLLWGVSPFSPVVYGAVCGVFALVAFGACHMASRRTLKLDPMIALRAE